MSDIDPSLVKTDVPQASVTDRFASLRKVREQLQAIGKGELTQEQPAPLQAAEETHRSVFKKRPATPPATAVKVTAYAAGEVQSKPYDAASVPQNAVKHFSPNLVPATDKSLIFQKLKMGHEKLGLDVSRKSNGVDANTPAPSKAADPQFFKNVADQAKLAKLYKLVDEVMVFYKGEPTETAQEKAYLATLSGTMLDDMRVAYEVSASHVALMTNDLHAQRAALEGNRTLGDYYRKHGTYEDQLEAEQSEAQEKARASEGRNSKGPKTRR